MADQRKITLRATHATPKNIILRELPVATPSAGTTIYLYENHATPKNIILRNPLVADAPAGGGAFEITATSSAIVLSGASVVLAVARQLSATTSSIALAASSTTLAVGYKISATSSAIVLSGSTATLTASRSIDATSSAISLAASTVTLGVGYVIEAQSSAIALSGSSVELTYTPAVALQGGGWLSESQLRDYDRERKKRREELDEIEATITLAYQRLTGKLSAAPIIAKAEGEPEKLAVQAEKLAAQLVSKASNSARLRTRNAAIIADLLRQADAILDKQNLDLQMEEEAIVILLAA